MLKRQGVANTLRPLAHAYTPGEGACPLPYKILDPPISSLFLAISLSFTEPSNYTNTTIKQHATPTTRRSRKNVANGERPRSRRFRRPTVTRLEESNSNARTVVRGLSIELLDDVLRPPLDRPRHPRNT